MVPAAAPPLETLAPASASTHDALVFCLGWALPAFAPTAPRPIPYLRRYLRRAGG
jgi:hypothetical protein